MTKPPQHYEVTFLEEWGGWGLITIVNKSSSSFQNFNQVEILHVHKLNLNKNKKRRKQIK